MRAFVRGASLLVATICGIGGAAADSIPGLRGHDHTGVTVPDMKQAVDFFTGVIGCKKAMSFGPFRDDKGVASRIVLPVNEGPAAGQTILYFQAPWGLQFEAISYPKGMAYEKGAETVLWSPKDPTR